MYGNWKYPAMIIRPGREKFIDDMVMFDPLYLIDSDHELLKPAIEKFPEDYQKRLRTYVIDELKNDHLLQQIPDNQFGLCLAFNLFNFRPLEVIRRYLTEIYQKLKPGGVILLTFNDCDRDKAVMLVEQHFASYTPGTLIQELASSIGYEPIFKWDDGGPSTWLEIKKPGTLTSLRGGQTLAKIIHKSVAESK
jgi:SAM-dependent methyltransferase